MTKLPRRAVIENQVAIAIEATRSESPTQTIAASELENVQGGLGFAPMYGAPLPPRYPTPRSPWGQIPWGKLPWGRLPWGRPSFPHFPFGHRRR